MKIITKYKEYLKLLESKKPDDFLSNYRNGLDFYLIDAFGLGNIDITSEKYDLIKKSLKVDGNFLKYKKYWTYGKSWVSFELFKNITDDENFGRVDISSLEKNESLEIYDNYYEVIFISADENGESLHYICDGELGIKKCIIYNVLYNEKYDNQIFYDEILNLLKPKQFQELMENVDYNQIVWYNNPTYIEYAISNNLVDLNKITYLSNLWYLVEKGTITKQDFVNTNTNWFLLKDNEVYIRYKSSDLPDLSFMFSENDGNRSSDSRDFVKNIDGHNYSRNDTSFSNLYLDYLKPESIKLIEDKIQEIKLTLDDQDQEEFENYDDWEEKVKNIDSLDELKNAIEDAFNYAQESADYDEMYDTIKKPILNLFGMDELVRDENDHYIFKLQKEFLIRFDNYFSEYYDSKNYNKKINVELIETWFELVYENEDSVEFLKIDFPYYGFDGTIDKKYLHECIEEKLNEI
jgi:hypothetical protein